MRFTKQQIVELLRDRGTEQQACGLADSLPESVDTERDRRPLELLGLGRGDLLKHCGGDASVVVRRHQASTT